MEYTIPLDNPLPDVKEPKLLTEINFEFYACLAIESGTERVHHVLEEIHPPL